MKVGIIGSRGFKDYNILNEKLKDIETEIKVVISGGAPGADRLAEKWAKEHGKSLTVYPADWLTYGKSAGYIRNADIVKNSDKIIAFWDGESKGTKHTINLCKKNNKECEVVLVSARN